jgi:hypothetical protein
MGVYIYSIRAKTVPVVMPFGQKVEANLYSYAYRLTSVWPGDYGYRGYKLTETNTERNASAVFAKDRSGVVIVGDLKDGLEGHGVYTDVTAGLWYDTERFPGTLIGWVKKVGKSYVVVDRTEWSKGTRELRGEQWVPVRTRSVMVDGVAKYESEDIEPETREALAKRLIGNVMETIKAEGG